MEQQLKATRRVVTEWWRWCNDRADALYGKLLKTPVMQRGHLKIAETLPLRWETIENWFLPKSLAVMPTSLKQAVTQEQTYGVEVRVVDLIFKLLVMMQPGSLDEQDHLEQQLCSPNPCKDAAAALKELRRCSGR